MYTFSPLYSYHIAIRKPPDRNTLQWIVKTDLCKCEERIVAAGFFAYIRLRRENHYPYLRGILFSIDCIIPESLKKFRIKIFILCLLSTRGRKKKLIVFNDISRSAIMAGENGHTHDFQKHEKQRSLLRIYGWSKLERGNIDWHVSMNLRISGMRLWWWSKSTPIMGLSTLATINFLVIGRRRLII